MARSQLLLGVVAAASLSFSAFAGCATAVKTAATAGSGGFGGAGGAGGGNGTAAGGAGGVMTGPTTTGHSTATGTTTTGTAGGSSTTSGMGGGGTCLHQADCANQMDACNTASCVNNVCVKSPVADGTTCDDGMFCTTGDLCLSGACTGGVPMACPGGDACHVGQCDEMKKACVTVPGNDGAACASNDMCVQGGSCANGSCQPGLPIDCSFLNQACTKGICDPAVGCKPAPANDGTACDDGLFCTDNDVCKAGACAGSPKMCAPPNDPCQIGSCNEALAMCSSMPGNNGAACPSPNPCLVGASCNAGVCGGGFAGNNGGKCSDSNACTTMDSCQSGVCVGGPAISACVSGDGCCPGNCTFANDADCIPPLFNQPSYTAKVTFQDALTGTTMGITWDGTSYWSCSGGGPSGNRLAQYSAQGTQIGIYQPGIDFRAVFTLDGKGTTVYERGYASSQVMIQQSPGVFAGGFTLSGAIDAQSNVQLSAAGEYVAQIGGLVTRRDANGNVLGTFTLNGYAGSENMYPQSRGIAIAGGYYLTYYNGTLSAWDGTGTRLKTTILTGAGTGFDAHFSLSYANQMVWIIDTAGGTWRGFDVGL